MYEVNQADTTEQAETSCLNLIINEGVLMRLKVKNLKLKILMLILRRHTKYFLSFLNFDIYK